MNAKKIWDVSWKEYDDLNKIIVTTNELFIPAQKNYESVGFKKNRNKRKKVTSFSGKYIDYEIKLKQ